MEIAYLPLNLIMETPISVEEAIKRVLLNVEPLPCLKLPLSTRLLNKIVAEDIIANSSFPPFPASIMDGYAVVGPIEPGIYPIVGKIHAGDSSPLSLSKGCVSYITTGAMLPTNANAVVKVEDTEKMEGDLVHIKVSTNEGLNVREIGSDIAKGDIIIKKGTKVGPHEIGMLATTGFVDILCYDSPIIGVMSTGNELVDPWIIPTGSQVRDCNRLSMITSCIEDGWDVIDLGIVSDSKEELKKGLLDAAMKCDIVISSGGVSMGAADFIKPLLKEIGTIHFSKLNMKPGKPTTFASYKRPNNSRSGKTLFFGLPGNPVSCLVTKALFVDTAVRRIQGLDSEASLHTQITIQLAGGPIKLDPERPEYHRAALVQVSKHSSIIHAYSTGNQRSSRLQSMLTANALLVLPQGPGMVEVGTTLQALLIRPLVASTRLNSVHPSAAEIDFIDQEESSKILESDSIPNIEINCEQYESFPRNSVIVSKDWRIIKVGLLTISDRASQGVYEDYSGPEMAWQLELMNSDSEFNLKFEIVSTATIPDDPESIRKMIVSWSTPNFGGNVVDLILTSGGTGFGIRDLTPESIRPLLHREAPGVAQSLINEGLKHTPLAVLSRPIVGTRYSTFICTLPGSVKAVKENIVCLKILLPRIMELLKADS